MLKKYEAAVVGGGPAGCKVAEILGTAGKKVCLIEAGENNLGGTCLNEGCVPVKSLVETSELYHKIQLSSHFGLSATVAPIDLNRVQAVLCKNIDQLKKGLAYILEQNKVDIIYGKAGLIKDKTLSVQRSSGEMIEIEAEDIILATGAKPFLNDILQPDGQLIVTPGEILKNRELPKRLLIVGGGSIGCEFASIYYKLGVNVTLIELRERLLFYEDHEIAQTLMREYRKNKITLMLETEILKATKREKEIILTIRNQNDSASQEVTADQVLICQGRVPNIEGIGLENVKIKTQGNFIAVDHNMQTCCPGIYAIGDLVPRGMTAHAAYHTAKIAARSVLKKQDSVLNAVEIIPRIVFSDPQVGCVGMTEIQAKTSQIDFDIYRYYFKGNAKAVIRQKTAGFVKLLVSQTGGQILGGMVIGEQAVEIVHELAVSISNGLKLNQLQKTVHAHPTLSEIFGGH